MVENRRARFDNVEGIGTEGSNGSSSRTADEVVNTSKFLVLAHSSYEFLHVFHDLVCGKVDDGERSVSEDRSMCSREERSVLGSRAPEITVSDVLG